MQIRQMTDHTGAEVSGIDLTRPVDAAARAALNRAFVAHHVLAIRDQRLEPKQVLAAVELFGPVFPQHNTKFALPDCPRSEEHTSELQSLRHLVCRLLLEKKKQNYLETKYKKKKKNKKIKKNKKKTY